MNAFTENKTDVLIVGAGPVGLMMACQLSFFNIRFRIIDKKQSPSNHSGALIVHAKTLELFQQMGLAGKVLNSGTKINGLTIFFEGKKKLRLDLTNFGTNVSQFPFMFLLKQSVTERLLIDFLKQAGHSVERGTEATEIVHQNGGVKTVLKKPDGTLEEAESRYLIAADGGQSTVRSFFKIPFIGKTNKMDLCILECKSNIDLQPNEIGFSFSENATSGFFPLSKNNWRIDVAPTKIPDENEKLLSFEVIQQLFDKQTHVNARIEDPELFSVFHSHKRYAAAFRNNSCFLIGDAAHLYSPVGAQGMNSGLQDAQNLAWKIGLVIRGLAKPQILATYEQERKPLARNVARITNYFHTIVASGNYFYKMFRLFLLPWFLRFFFHLIQKERISAYIFKKISGTGIRYKTNAVNKRNRFYKNPGVPKPGERLPFLPYMFEGSYTNIRDNIQCTTFHLLLFSKEENSVGNFVAITRKYEQAVSTEIIPFLKETGGLYKKFGIDSGGWFLVRPDYHIAACSAELDTKKLKSYLSQVLY